MQELGLRFGIVARFPESFDQTAGYDKRIKDDSRDTAFKRGLELAFQQPLISCGCEIFGNRGAVLLGNVCNDEVGEALLLFACRYEVSGSSLNHGPEHVGEQFPLLQDLPRLESLPHDHITCDGLAQRLGGSAKRGVRLVDTYAEEGGLMPFQLGLFPPFVDNVLDELSCTV